MGCPEKTFSSLCLMLVIYFPFVFKPIASNSPNKPFYALYFRMVFFLGLAGVTQFFAQFLFSPSWLFDYRPFLPDLLRNLNVMNTVIPIGNFLKSNGFFSLEPSFFSQWMALGLFFFGLFSTSFLSFFVFLSGLICSFSGTGLILAFLVCCFSLAYFEQKRRWVLILFFGLFVFLGFLYPNSFLMTRIDEFKAGAGVRTTSAAARFITPLFLVEEGLKNSPKSFFFGNGPGTITKVTRDFESHDPVWAKLFFEYGLVGSFALLFFLFSSAKNTRNSFLFSFLFFIQWFFLGGHLLSFDIVSVYVVYYKLATLY